MAAKLAGRLNQLEAAARAKRTAAQDEDHILTALINMDETELDLFLQNMIIALGKPIDEAAAAIWERATRPGAVLSNEDVSILLANLDSEETTI